MSKSNSESDDESLQTLILNMPNIKNSQAHRATASDDTINVNFDRPYHNRKIIPLDKYYKSIKHGPHDFITHESNIQSFEKFISWFHQCIRNAAYNMLPSGDRTLMLRNKTVQSMHASGLNLKNENIFSKTKKNKKKPFLKVNFKSCF